MAKVKKFGPVRIKKIPGGKDPSRLVEEFILRRGHDPDASLRARTGDDSTWCVQLAEDEELEITLEGISRPLETTLYLGINIMMVPLKSCERYLASALVIADKLIGAKLSLVNYDIVLSTTAYLGDKGVEDIDYFFEILQRQRSWVRDEIIQEANRDELDGE